MAVGRREWGRRGGKEVGELGRKEGGIDELGIGGWRRAEKAIRRAGLGELIPICFDSKPRLKELRPKRAR